MSRQIDSLFAKFTTTRMAERCYEADSAEEYAALVAQNWSPMYQLPT